VNKKIKVTTQTWEGGLSAFPLPKSICFTQSQSLLVKRSLLVQAGGYSDMLSEITLIKEIIIDIL
jgi:hypothetical protein